MDDPDTGAAPGRVVVSGGGVAGLSAGTFLARAGFDTVVLSGGESILRRNAHLENVPGFPAGVNPRLFADLLERGAERGGCLLEEGRVVGLRPDDGEFRVRVDPDTGGGDSGGDAATLVADSVLAASWSDPEYLRGIDAVGLVDLGSKTYVDVDEGGRTGVEGLYAAGRLAGKAHQTVVCAGHGAEVALALIEDSEVPFYHDWVAPEGYFTDRGREVPPGCEEIDAEERRRRERESMAVMAEAFETPHGDEPTAHPSLSEEGAE
ncbi:oxidoreductase (homolog to thioredoxin-disulfide reductase) [Natronomonas moolapensis 8.8.11]|uniref:Oxidoreductase (Homolog to thioredoxin-disulfide reductase) n=1 Tax=Natronomonas moolapensis (strain DSM 18674 / CECT 7526 / JCM 14361 / 8.8.11) TaxID=268739 RepID=M1XZX1_NATM8|nr:FAD-binding protein [Natronomonas moolapensis]CCQ35730.1 oxidoreductase (homolog to thioredoxin-disulfide reductase) [Natronomonas moolapensis 8.8.11]